MTYRVAILGSGNIGTDLLEKLHRHDRLELVGVAGIEPSSDGLARAEALGYFATSNGLLGLLRHTGDIDVVFDATSARAHIEHVEHLISADIRCIDLTPAGLGPALVPPVNIGDHTDAHDVSLVTCGAQATVPIVHAVAKDTAVTYAEIVSTIASKSAGPGTRQNIDEFTRATGRALESIGGSQRGKAIIILNPAEPPIMMRNTIHMRAPDLDEHRATEAISQMVAEVAAYVPGYSLRADPLIDDDQITVMLEVEGSGDYLPPYAGNLDIMTAAAVRAAEELSFRQVAEGAR